MMTASHIPRENLESVGLVTEVMSSTAAGDSFGTNSRVISI